MTYVGRDTALVLWPASGTYEFWDLGFNGSIHPTVEDYLELHPEIAELLTWPLHDSAPSYRDWDLYQWTQGFHATLSRFFDEASWGGPITLAFAQEDDPALGPNRKRVGPAPAPRAPSGDRFMFTLRDMGEIWLAHVAQYLSVEIFRQVPWHLHDLSRDLLAVNLPGSQMVETMDGVPRNQEPLYRPNKREAGGGLATDPSPVLAFALQTGLLKASRGATVDAICRWVHENLVHYSPALPRDYRASWDWEFQTPPIVTMLEPRLDYLLPEDPVPRYRAWRGCRGASSVMCFLARVLNVPARGTQGYIPNQHGAVDFPEQGWFCPHADDFYAREELNDPAILPIDVVTPTADYERDRHYWTEVAQGAASSDTTYLRWLYLRAKDLPTFWLIEAHWMDRIDNLAPNSTAGKLAHALRSHGLSEAEIASEMILLAPRIQTIIDDFIQRPEHQPGMTLQEGLAAYRVPIDAWKAAKGTS